MMQFMINVFRRIYLTIYRSKLAVLLFAIVYEIRESAVRKQLKDMPGKTTADQRQNVAILLDKGLGDFLVAGYYLEQIIKHYHGQGKKVYILCDNYNIHFLKIKDLHYDELICGDFRDIKELCIIEELRMYRGFFDVPSVRCP